MDSPEENIEHRQNTSPKNPTQNEEDHHRVEAKVYGFLVLWIFADFLVIFGHVFIAAWILYFVIIFGLGLGTFHATKGWPTRKKVFVWVYAITCIALPFLLFFLSRAHATLSSPQRAQIAVRLVEFLPVIPKAGDTPEVNVDFYNCGQTIAKKCYIAVSMDMPSKGQEPSFLYHGRAPVPGGILGAGLDFNTSIKPAFVHDTGEPFALTQEMIDKFKSGDLQLFVYGKVDYEDVNGIKHWITFCVKLRDISDGAFIVYDKYNESDSN